MEKEFARPSYKKVKGEDMTDGKFKTMDDKVYTSTKGAEFVVIDYFKSNINPAFIIFIG